MNSPITSRYRYSKIGGKTPLKALSVSKAKLRFPPNDIEILKHRLKKPTTGKYHLVRFIRSDMKINMFGEIFPVPPELKHEYVVATIDVKEHYMNLFVRKSEVEEIKYILR